MTIETVVPGAKWLTNIKITDKSVSFHLGITGESWVLVLKNATTGLEETRKSGYSNGNHILVATTYGAHILEIHCGWGTTNPCQVLNFIIPAPSCTPSWICETPLNGYEKDGCGNRRLSFDCKPSLPPVVPPVIPPILPPVVPPVIPPIVRICTEGTTRQVKCPSSDKMVTQKCTGNAWITIKDECKEIITPTEDYTNIIIVVIIIILFMILSRK